MLCEKLKVSSPYYKKYEEAALSCYDSCFFSKNHLIALADELELDERNRCELFDFIDNADDNIKKFMWLYYYIQYKTEEDFHKDIWADLDHLPVPELCESRFPGMIKATVYLLAFENLKEWVIKSGLKSDIYMAYKGRYKYMVKLNRISYNTSGFLKLAPFCYIYTKPYAIVVGRLAFQLVPFTDHFDVYENKERKRLLVATDKNLFDESGHISEEGFRPVYKINGEILTAHLIDENGLICREPSKINLKEYKRVLTEGDSVATIHIPEGGKLDIDLVKKSIRDAYKIINSSLMPVKAIVCRTWFIDPGIRYVFKETSNMKKFSELFDIACWKDNKNHSIFEHIFVVKKQPLENLVPKNDFQRVMLDRALKGEKIYWSYGVLKAEEELKLK